MQKIKPKIAENVNNKCTKQTAQENGKKDKKLSENPHSNPAPNYEWKKCQKKTKNKRKENFKHKKNRKKQKRWVGIKRAIQMKYVWMLLLLRSLNPWWARGPSDRHVNACYANCVCLGKSINKSWHQICKQRQAKIAESLGEHNLPWRVSLRKLCANIDDRPAHGSMWICPTYGADCSE